MKNNKSKENLLLIVLVIAAAAIGVLANMNNKAGRAANPQAAAAEPGTETAAAPTVSEAAPILIAEKGTGVTVTTSADWAEKYPNEYNSYVKNDENDEIHSYIELHPYITTLYRGYGFAIQYGSARGHTYVVEDVTSTGRPHKLANCFTCKTSTMTAKALNEGDSAYAAAFEDVEVHHPQTMGGHVWWTDVEETQGLRIQRNIISAAGVESSFSVLDTAVACVYRDTAHIVFGRRTGKTERYIIACGYGVSLLALRRAEG